jgi:hypothetical protein
MDDEDDLATLLSAVLRAWNSDRSAMVRLDQLSQRTSTSLCHLMTALRTAETAGAVPVLLSMEAIKMARVALPGLRELTPALVRDLAPVLEEKG